MAINVKEIIGRVRSQIIMDTDSSDYRWPDPTMIEFANQTVYEMLKLKPHLLIDGEGDPSRSDAKMINVTPESVSAGTAVWELPSKYEEAIIHGIARRCFLQDSSDQVNAQRSVYEAQRFYELLGKSVGVTAQQ